MKDALGHGSNPGRGNNRADTIARGRAIDEKRYPTRTTEQRAATADQGRPKAEPDTVPLGQAHSQAATQLLAAKLFGSHSNGIHNATMGKKL
jgi:hypothetical protein